MKMRQKVLLGVGTFWPFVYLPFFIFWLFNKNVLNRDFIINLHLFTWAILMIMIGNYFIFVMRDIKMSPTMKIYWFLFLFFGNVFAMVIYWYQYIWKEKR